MITSWVAKIPKAASDSRTPFRVSPAVEVIWSIRSLGRVHPHTTRIATRDQETIAQSCLAYAPQRFRISAAQRGQTDAGGLEPAIHRQCLAGDVAGAIGTQEHDGVGDFAFRPIAVQRD